MTLSFNLRTGLRASLLAGAASLLAACGGGSDLLFGSDTVVQVPGPTVTVTISTPVSASGTATIAGGAHVVAHTRKTYTANTGGSAYSWVWGDGTANATTNPAPKVWHKPGSYSAAVGVVSNGSLAVATQAITVADPLAAGNDHSCALRPDSTVSCWGSNVQGALGDGTGLGIKTNLTVVGLTNATAVTSGSSFSCALKADASVVCWGRNTEGELGAGSLSTGSPSPLTVKNLTNAVAVSANRFHACAVKADSTVVCWGDNANGQLGAGILINQNQPIPVLSVAGVGLLSGVESIATGSDHTCALKTDGTVVCWGYNANGQLGQNNNISIESSIPQAVPNLSGVVALNSGDNHTCALKQDSSVWCWGRNAAGQLGDGTTVDKDYPVAVVGLLGDTAAVVAGTALTDVVTGMALGGDHTCVIGTAGSIFCWGKNNRGQLGNGANTNSASPVAVNTGAGGAVAISLGFEHSCALRNDAAVRCWGANNTYQLGNTTPLVDSNVPTSPTVGGFAGSVFWQ